MNHVVIVGRLTSNPEVVDTEGGNKVTSINLAVSRMYKNADGIYETDFIRCVLWNGIALNTSEFCKCGDIVGIKGRLQSSSYEDENGIKHYVTEVVAERVTFLSSSGKDKSTVFENNEVDAETKIKKSSKKTGSKSKEKTE